MTPVHHHREPEPARPPYRYLQEVFKIKLPVIQNVARSTGQFPCVTRYYLVPLVVVEDNGRGVSQRPPAAAACVEDEGDVACHQLHRQEVWRVSQENEFISRLSD